MPVHEVAQRGFGSEARTYERSRPSYPPDAVAWLVEHLRIRSGRAVCDLAAGTGKLTRLLEPTGARLVAVEPVVGMRDVLALTLPGVAVVAGTAEALPFADESLDAVTVAQAFHWFDAARALPELRRVLRPGGRLGLVWNARTRDPGWVDELWSILDRVERRAPWRDHDRAGPGTVFGATQDALAVDRWFGPLHEAEFRNDQVLSPDGVVERIQGTSHVAVLEDDARARCLDAVRELLASHPDTAGHHQLVLPYRVDAYWCERR